MFDEVQVLWFVLVTRVRAARSDDTGASALEWAIIAAVSVVMAVLIGGIIFTVVKDRSNDISTCNTKIGPGSKC